jgi:hypothetical protein
LQHDSELLRVGISASTFPVPVLLSDESLVFILLSEDELALLSEELLSDELLLLVDIIIKSSRR